MGKWIEPMWSIKMHVLQCVHQQCKRCSITPIPDMWALVEDVFMISRLLRLRSSAEWPWMRVNFRNTLIICFNETTYIIIDNTFLVSFKTRSIVFIRYSAVQMAFKTHASSCCCVEEFVLKRQMGTFEYWQEFLRPVTMAWMLDGFFFVVHFGWNSCQFVWCVRFFFPSFLARTYRMGYRFIFGGKRETAIFNDVGLFIAYVVKVESEDTVTRLHGFVPFRLKRLVVRAKMRQTSVIWVLHAYFNDQILGLRSCWVHVHVSSVRLPCNFKMLSVE